MAAEIELGGKSKGLMKNQEYRKAAEERLRQRENDQDKGGKGWKKNNIKETLVKEDGTFYTFIIVFHLLLP